MPQRKKLVEGALPLEAINGACPEMNAARCHTITTVYL